MNLRNLFSSKSPAVVPAPTGQPMCTAGHALDPHWGGVCPYCQAIDRGREKTAATRRVDLDATVIAPPTEDGPPSVPSGERETRIAAPASLHAGRETRIAPPSSTGRETRIAPADGPPPVPATTDTRRITAVLVSFGGGTDGRFFAIRDGRNTIGRGDFAAARHCDVEVTGDAGIAVEHAVILGRAGRHELLDLGSATGTEMNGMPIGSQVVELADHGLVRIGSTVFEFLRIAGVPAVDEAAGTDAGAAPTAAPIVDRTQEEDPDRTRIG